MSRFLLITLFVVGLYGPTSFGGVYSESTWLCYFVFLPLIFVLLIFRKNGLGDVRLCLNSILLLAIILGATILSPFPDYRWGGLLGFALLAMMYTLNVRDLDGSRFLQKIFYFANVVNVCLGFAIVVGLTPIREFFVSYYTAFYPELTEYMTSVGKPVLTFGTHSIAAFFFFIFFWLNFETYKVRQKKSFLVFALSYIVLCVLLVSVTGLLLTPVAVFRVLSYFSRKRPKLALASVGVACLIAGYELRQHPIDLEELTGFSKAAVAVATSSTSGFLGRFSQFGTLYSTVNYLKNRPFSPIGVGFRDDLFVGDCGPVEYYLRGSVFLVLAVYGGLWFFLRNNLVSRADLKFFFLLILAFEVGITSLTHSRTLYLLPVFIVYLNDLRRSTPGFTVEEGRGVGPAQLTPELQG